jgi:hypothetical protein
MLDIEWSGTSHTDEIDNIKHALDQTECFLKKNTHLDLGVFYEALLSEIDEGVDSGPFCELWIEAEHYFSKIAFEGWSSVPDNWSLVC